jgi:hypothetical protein
MNANKLLESLYTPKAAELFSVLYVPLGRADQLKQDGPKGRTKQKTVQPLLVYKGFQAVY